MNVESLEQKAKDLVDHVMPFASVQQAFVFLRSAPITNYSYHNERHTLDVMHESALFGLGDDLSLGDLELLLIAAAWHDVGFSQSPVQHELVGAQLFTEHYEREKYSEIPAGEIENIKQMILDTKVQIVAHGAGSQQIARTHLSRYLLDADLSNLGRTDFFDCFERLKGETSANEFDFHVATLGLISRHRWNTSVAESLRLEQEMKNAHELVFRIKALHEFS